MLTNSIQRPQRWDQPFGEMTEANVASVLSAKPFDTVEKNNFPSNLSLDDILKNDARIINYKRGDVIVRRGDYGNSAFFVLAGMVRVAVEPFPESWLGRATSKKRGLFGAISQLWRNSKTREARDVGTASDLPEARRDSNNEVRIFLDGLDDIIEKYETAQIGQGESFGEIAALARTPRTATVVADTSCELLEIRWQGLRDIRARSAIIRDYIDERYRAFSLDAHLRESKLFRHLSHEDLRKVSEQTRFETYGSFNWYTNYKSMVALAPKERTAQEPIIAHAGDYPNGVVLVRGGFARVSQPFDGGHRTLRYIGNNQMYGFEEICHNWRHKGEDIPFQFTLSALGYVDVLVVPSIVLETIVLPSLPADFLPSDPPFSHMRQCTDKALGAYKQFASNKATGEQTRTDLLEKLVEGRFINGTTTMMINLDRCTRCDDCVRACAAAHNNNPRFIRHGAQIGKFMVANACMHCADPVCMIGCPTGAIHRNPDGGQVIINDSACIGCATCANSCPYENIRMVQIRDRKGTFLTDNETRQPILKATKCDLCVDQLTAPSCERACPHDALKRLDMLDLDTVVDWMEQ